MRLLHLIDAAGPQATATTLAMIADGQARVDGVHQQVMLLGGPRLRRAAVDAGVTDAIVTGVPFGQAVAGWPAVHARLKQLRRAGGPIDLVHCWSIGALSLATIMMRHTPRLLTLTVAPSPAKAHWLAMLVSESAGQTTLLAISSTIRRALVGGGVPEANVHVLRPAIDMGRVEHGARTALRARWKLTNADDRVIALISDPATAADAVLATRSLGLAAEALRGRGEPHLRLLVHPDQLNRRRGEQIVMRLGRYERLIRDQRTQTPWQTLPGCDLALAIGPNGGGLSLLWAMAANIPIIAQATYAISEIVEDRHSALLVKNDEPRLIAQRIQQLLADPQLAWQLRDTARHEAYSFFSRQRYCRALGGVYEQLLAGRPIEVPPMESTGGLRFSGRA